MFKTVFLLLFFLCSNPAMSLEIAGVTVPESLNTDLLLNGAGTKGWNEGFSGNLTPEQGTMVSIAGELKGTVAGADFNRALLSIWLGKDPVGDDLRNALLGNKE